MSWTILLLAVGLVAGQPLAAEVAGPSTVPVTTAPPQGALSVGPVGSLPTLAPHASTSNLTFPRTVLIETFTGVWCIHCPYESQALYDIDVNASHSAVAIAELHICAFGQGQSPCLDNYVPPDNTSYQRIDYYDTCGGVPDVFFDGQHDVCGAYPSQATMRNAYLDDIANASRYPGNVSITDNAVRSVVVNGTNTTPVIVDHVNITSGLTGSYNEVSYLMEYIGKRNVTVGYGPHDVAWVVRETLRNHPVNLTAGETTPLTITGDFLPSWNQANMSVISFVQDNATKVVENSNFAIMNTMATSVSATKTTVDAGDASGITVTATNTTTGDPVVGATVTFNSSAGGSFDPATGVTGANGEFTTTFTAPDVTSQVAAVVTALVTDTGYSIGNATTAVVVLPLYPPAEPTGLAVLPGVSALTLNWTAPSTGAGGVTYFLYVSDALAGPFTFLTTTSTPSFTDSGLAPGQTLWFQVSAQDVGGFSSNTSAVSATPVNVQPVGLPLTVGWWIALDGQNLTDNLGSPELLFLPSGLNTYSYGSTSYGLVPSESAMGSVSVSTTPLTLNLTFAPRLATLSGTVSPTSALVSFNGTTLSVSSGGTFSWISPPGTYLLNVSASGYVPYSKAITLTPGNVSSVTVSLTPSKTTGGTIAPSNSGFSGSEEVEILAVVAAVVVAGVLGSLVLMSRSRPKAPPPRSGARPAARPPPQAPPKSP